MRKRKEKVKELNKKEKVNEKEESKRKKWRKRSERKKKNWIRKKKACEKMEGRGGQKWKWYLTQYRLMNL